MMNYREEVLTDKNVLDRLSTSSYRETRLCDQLSKLEVVQDEVQPTGLFSRIKSTLFASHEASIRFPFVTSCTIVASTGRSRDPASFFCVRADGRCSLLKPVLDSPTASATELASYSVPPSADGYCSTSLHLGNRQGSLVAVSLDEGRIVLLSVTASSISLAKTLHLPVTKPISHLCLKDRNGLVELYVGVDKRDVFIVPDVRKSDKFAFLYSNEIRLKIKECTNSTVTHSLLEKIWATHKKPLHVSPIQSTVLLGSRFDPFKDSLDFLANYVVETIEEMVNIRGSLVPPSVRLDCMRRVKSAIANAIDSRSLNSNFYPTLIANEFSRIAKSPALIDSIEYDEQTEMVIIAYDSGVIREILPIESELSTYVLTFLSLPVTFKITNKTLSQSAAADLFDGSKNWLNVFACCSVGEAGESVPPPVAEYLNTCISQSAGSAKLLVDKIKNFINSEKVHSWGTISKRGLHVKVQTMEYLIRNLIALDKFATGTSPDKASLRMYTRLEHARFILEKLGDDTEDVVSSRCEFMGIKCLEDFLNQLGMFFFPPRMFSADTGLIAASVDASYDTLAQFHIARVCVQEDKAKAWEIFLQVEMEISLMVDLIKPTGIPPLAGTPPLFHYYQYLLELFLGDYEHEVLITEKLIQLAKDEKLLQQLRNNAIEKSIANGDWDRVKKYIDLLPAGGRPDMIRLMCTEARIRNELPKIFDVVKSSPEMIQLILADIDAELDTNFTLSNAIQAYNLNLVVQNFPGAINAAIKIYEGLICPYTCIAGSVSPDDDTVFDIVDINTRLDWQLKALVLARCVYGKCGARFVKTLKYSVRELEKRVAFVDGLRALYSYTEDPIESILDPRGGVVAIEVCRNLAAVGLVKLALKIARLFSLDVFKSVILPYVELVLKCQKDSSFLPPCRFEKTEDGLAAILPPVTPSMAFTRSDSTGPIGSGGDQLKAMYMMLESILRSKEIPNWAVFETIEFLYLNLVSSGCPSALVAIAEERGMWLELLRMHMRTENFKEAVRLVECHVRYWKPRVMDGVDTKMRLDVPLLVQLQRALEIVRGEYPDAEWLSVKLGESLDELKSTLALLSERMILGKGN